MLCLTPVFLLCSCVQACNRAWARVPQSYPVWNDFKEAAQTIVPSQLALLDVIQPPPHDVDGNDWKAIHEASWKSFTGYDAVKRRLYQAVVSPWRRVYLSTAPSNPTVDTFIHPPSGVLFYGPSGCGKTVCAGYLASSLSLPMIRVRAADVLDKWLGGSEATIRSLFARARSAAPCILFLDEIDAIATNRSSSDDSVDVMSRVLSTLLNEMDGVSTDRMAPRVLVVACTNRKEALDAALLRPGRLDEHVELQPLKRAEEVEKVLVQYLGRAAPPSKGTLDLHGVAEELLKQKSLTGAELEGLCRASVLKAMRRATTLDQNISVTRDDLITSLTRS